MAPSTRRTIAAATIRPVLRPTPTAIAAIVEHHGDGDRNNGGADQSGDRLRCSHQPRSTMTCCIMPCLAPGAMTDIKLAAGKSGSLRRRLGGTDVIVEIEAIDSVCSRRASGSTGAIGA